MISTLMGSLAIAMYSGVIFWAFTGKFRHAILAMLLVGLSVYLLADAQARRTAEKNTARAAEWQAWRDRVTAQGCQQTSYVATKLRIWPVWTCPDGSAQLDHLSQPQPKE